jgi:hypothetical protein
MPLYSPDPAIIEYYSEVFEGISCLQWEYPLAIVSPPVLLLPSNDRILRTCPRPAEFRGGHYDYSPKHGLKLLVIGTS